MNTRSKGINSALASAVFLALAPIFGKQAILIGLSPLAVVALRTVLAAALLLSVTVVFKPRYLYIYPVGLLGCMLAGGINGLGSLFYYSALGRIGAGVGQLIYSLYPFFVAIWLLLDHQPPSRLTLLRLLMAILAIYLLTQAGETQLDLTGVLLMLLASILYALHLPINQRVLYDVPAPTVTLYTLLSMSAVVVPAYLLFGAWDAPAGANVWLPVVGLTLVTFLSRITLFLGVKHLGGMQTALLGLAELFITITLAHLWLGERMTGLQWAGTALLGISFLMIGWERKEPPHQRAGGWLRWISPPAQPSELPWQPQK
jgi:drug/metabolite transporter (DMT)-like permease